MAASMLTGVSDRLPTADELTRAEGVLSKATGAGETLEMSLSRLLGPEGPGTFTISAEQAWHLTYFAKGLRIDGERLCEFADKIESAVEVLYMEAGAEERRAA